MGAKRIIRMCISEVHYYYFGIWSVLQDAYDELN